MIHILHGENTAKSRETLHQFKDKYSNYEILSYSAPIELTTVKQSIESQSLFSKPRLLILENALSSIGRKKRDDVSDYLAISNDDIDIVLWEGKQLTPGVLGKFKKAKVSIFKYDATLFEFLDSLGLEKKISLSLLHKTLEREAAELVFFMITRHIRILLGLKLNANIPEVSKMAPWIRGKYTRSLSQFTEKKLTKLLMSLFSIEQRWKSGNMDESLVWALDNLILSI